jgi:hypothetical protein
MKQFLELQGGRKGKKEKGPNTSGGGRLLMPGHLVHLQTRD